MDIVFFLSLIMSLFFSQGYDVHVIDVKKVAKVTKVQLYFSLLYGLVQFIGYKRKTCILGWQS